MAEELADQVQTESQVIQSPEKSAPEAPAESVRGDGQLGEQKPEKRLSLRDEIKKSIKSESAKLEPVSRETKPAEDGERPRGADGKFLPKEAAPETAAAEKPVPQAKPETKPAVQPSAAVAPSGWSKESKAVWNSLPPSVQSDALRREAEMAKGQQEYREKTRTYEELDRVLAPHREAIKSYGVTEPQFVNQMMSWHLALSNNPAVAFPALMQAYRFDPATMAPQSEQPSSADPAALRAQVQQFLQPVVQDLNAVKSDLQKRDEARILSEIQSFAKDKPYFDQVKQTMGQLMIGGVVAPNDLEGAYQRAIWMHDEIRDALQKEAFDKQVKEQQERADKARAAAISTPGRAPQGPVTNGSGQKPKGTRAHILAAMEEVREKSRA